MTLQITTDKLMSWE